MASSAETNPIESHEPSSWRELQEGVARILREAGVIAIVEKSIRTARGEVSIDVWAHDPEATPVQTYLIECKRWRARVPQTVVHAFRAVVGDSGANWGAIISSTGFQKGARAAAEYSNVRLFSWSELQSLFADRWYSRYFVTETSKETEALVEYTETINSRLFRRADLLHEEHRKKFRRLREAHMGLGSLCMLIRSNDIGALKLVLGTRVSTCRPDLPLRSRMESYLAAHGMLLPAEILDATSYRPLLESIIKEAKTAIAQFDELFGGRA